MTSHPKHLSNMPSSYVHPHILLQTPAPAQSMAGTASSLKSWTKLFLSPITEIQTFLSTVVSLPLNLFNLSETSTSIWHLSLLWPHLNLFQDKTLRTIRSTNAICQFFLPFDGARPVVLTGHVLCLPSVCGIPLAKNDFSQWSEKMQKQRKTVQQNWVV